MRCASFVRLCIQFGAREGRDACDVTASKLITRNTVKDSGLIAEFLRREAAEGCVIDGHQKQHHHGMWVCLRVWLVGGKEESRNHRDSYL